MGTMDLAMKYGDAAPLPLQIVVDLSFTVACAGGGLFVMAGCLRFATTRSRILDDLSNKSFGMYLFHYVFVVWLQYALLGVALFAIGKAAIVFGGTLILAWAITAAVRHVPYGSLLLGAERRALADTQSPRGNLAVARQTDGDRSDFMMPGATVHQREARG
jgi:hypothetical protein